MVNNVDENEHREPFKYEKGRFQRVKKQQVKVAFGYYNTGRREYLFVHTVAAI